MNGNGSQHMLSTTGLMRRFGCGQAFLEAALAQAAVTPQFEFKHGRGVGRLYDQTVVDKFADEIERAIAMQRAATRQKQAAAGRQAASRGNGATARFPGYATLCTEVRELTAKVDRLLALWESKP